MDQARYASDELALVVRHVSKSFGGKRGGSLRLPWQRRQDGGATGDNGDATKVVAVADVNLEVHRREIFGILGPNGSGKSTLVRLTATLLVPDEGQIEVFGLDVIRHEMAVKRLINRVSVDAAFFKKLSGLENLMYAGRLHGLSGREAREQAFAILRRLGLNDKQILGPLEDRSRGMQQKVAIARAFLTQPTLLLLDEPTTGLDPRSKREVQTFVRELRENHDATMLLTTHDMHEAEALCDRIAILDEGRVVALDTPLGLKALVPGQNGSVPTLEDVFMALTGKELVKEEDRVAM